jgi:hypothetical protein
MSRPVARLPSNGPSDGHGVTPVDVYKKAIDEYRFQVQYNWSRIQYLLAFNTAILAAATAVASRPGQGAAGVFALGVIAAVSSVLVVRTQHDYYRAARDHLRLVERTLELREAYQLDTTSTMGKRSRLVSVNQVVYFLLGAIALGDLIGVVLVVSR